MYDKEEYARDLRRQMEETRIRREAEKRLLKEEDWKYLPKEAATATAHPSSYKANIQAEPGGRLSQAHTLLRSPRSYSPRPAGIDLDLDRLRRELEDRRSENRELIAKIQDKLKLKLRNVLHSLDPCTLLLSDLGGMSRVVDLSFRSCQTFAELGSKVKDPPSEKKSKKIGCLKINNNKLDSVDGLHDLAQTALGSARLVWLDASFNEISRIASLPELQTIKVLYLHGNKLKDLHETLAVLRKLPDLQSVTLNGNAFENVPGYRLTILGALPQLRSIDHAAVTLDERERANMWFQYSHKH